MLYDTTITGLGAYLTPFVCLCKAVYTYLMATKFVAYQAYIGPLNCCLFSFRAARNEVGIAQ
jgi:hypothetical protein